MGLGSFFSGSKDPESQEQPPPQPQRLQLEEPPANWTGWVVLIFVRMLTIISLLALMVSDGIMINMNGRRTNYFVFHDVTHVFCLAIALLIAIAECEICTTWYRKHWPLLGTDRGLWCSGVVIVILGLMMLGNLDNEDHTKLKEKVDQLDALFMASGIAAIVVGLINIISCLIFRNNKTGLRARAIRGFRSKVLPDDDDDVEAANTPAPTKPTQDLSRASTIRSTPDHQHPQIQSPQPAAHPEEQPQRHSQYAEHEIVEEYEPTAHYYSPPTPDEAAFGRVASHRPEYGYAGGMIESQRASREFADPNHWA